MKEYIGETILDVLNEALQTHTLLTYREVEREVCRRLPDEKPTSIQAWWTKLRSNKFFHIIKKEGKKGNLFTYRLHTMLDCMCVFAIPGETELEKAYAQNDRTRPEKGNRVQDMVMNFGEYWIPIEKE
jgi:hypothetical protein